MSLSALDKRILEMLQRGVPLVREPWGAISRQLGLDRDLLLRRIRALKQKGLIRRIGATFDARQMKFASTLIAIKAAPENIDALAAEINAYDEVTHNYKRNGDYNLWFTLVAKGNRRIKQIVSEIRRDPRVISLLDLPALKLFKIGVSFTP